MAETNFDLGLNMTRGILQVPIKAMSVFFRPKQRFAAVAVLHILHKKSGVLKES